MGPSADGAAKTTAQVAELAREFEAILMAQMLRQMRQSLLSDDEADIGLGGETMTETMEVELARQLAAQGGIGLAPIIERGLAQQLGQGPGKVSANPRDVVPSPLVGSTTRPMPYINLKASAPVPESTDASPVVPIESPIESPVSSAFGWRRDPFHGLQRFHAGVDFRAAYGREVQTAAPGRVTFAGDQGGYGATVVVEHPGGVQTRYAHLSSITVSPGQELASGDIVGRVGQSGRATGPHLHFEVLVNGRRVDPQLAATGVPGTLKPGLADVDSSFDRASLGVPANGADHED